MTDGAGRVDYSYDTLSRLQSESRQFNGLSGTYTLSYNYNLGGELKTITDPSGASVGYTHDVMGQLTDVSGTAYGGVVSYASNMQYRAWGATRHMSYGNGLALDVTYNNRLQTASFTVTGRAAQYGQSAVISKSYDYYDDGSIRYAHDQLNNLFDRAFVYDHVGRVQQAVTGTEAQGTNFNPWGNPYRQTYQYDVWGNLTNRDGRYWSEAGAVSAAYNAGTGRNAAWQYDASGRVVQDEGEQYAVDAAGRVVLRTSVEDGRNTVGQDYDGDGERVKWTQHFVYYPTSGPNQSTGQVRVSTVYSVKSSVLGGRAVTELDTNGQKNRTYVYANGQAIAWQTGTFDHTINWNVEEPVTGARRETQAGGNVTGMEESDAMGVDVGTVDPKICGDVKETQHSMALLC